MNLTKTIENYIFTRVMGKLDWIQFQFDNNAIDKNAYYDGLTEIIIEKALQPGAVCIDVGAHEGIILKQMIKSAPKGQFFAFEPLPHLYKALVKKFRKPNIKIFDCALRYTVGESTLNYVITAPGYCGLKKRRYDNPNEEDTQITVKTELLDNILSNENAGPVSLIKIDVEGAEYFVMKGGQERIKKDKPIIIFEHGVGGSDCYNIGTEDIYHLLSDICGLRISLLPAWLRQEKSLDLDGFREQYNEGKNYYFIAHK